MADSWRISIVNKDVSSVAIPSIGNDGAMVIRSEKGPTTPVFIQKGDTDRLKTLFGEPSVSYPDTWEAMQYLAEAGCWISAPYPIADKFNAISVKNTGMEVVGGGQSQSELDGYTFANSDEYFIVIQNSPTVKTEEYGIDLAFASATGVWTMEFYLIDNDGAYGLEGDTIDFSLDANAVDGFGKSIYYENVFEDNDFISVSHNTGFIYNSFVAEVRAIGSDSVPVGSEPIGLSLSAKVPAVAEISGVDTVANTTGSLDGLYFIISSTTVDYYVWYSTNGTGADPAVALKTGINVDLIVGDSTDAEVATQTKTVLDALNAGATFSVAITSGNEMAVTNITAGLADDAGAATSTFTVATDTQGAAEIATVLRTAGSAITLTELTAGWLFFQSADTYKADIFMDPTTMAGVEALFDTLSNTYQKYAQYLLMIPLGDSVTTAISTKDAFGINTPNLAFYFNNAKVRWKNTSFFTSLIGRIGQKHAQMVDAFNGYAPAGIDENNHGGQLGAGILEMEFTPTEAQLQDLDTAGLNGIKLTPSYGTFIASHKTAKTPSILSDYSWIPHNRVFNYIKENIIDQVLVFQLVKLNDPAHRNQVRIKSEGIVDPIVDEGLLTEVEVICDETNNTDEILAQRKFILNVLVKVTPFSETIEFVFTNIAQTTTIAETVSAS